MFTLNCSIARKYRGLSLRNGAKVNDGAELRIQAYRGGNSRETAEKPILLRSFLENRIFVGRYYPKNCISQAQGSIFSPLLFAVTIRPPPVKGHF